MRSRCSGARLSHAEFLSHAKPRSRKGAKVGEDGKHTGFSAAKRGAGEKIISRGDAESAEEGTMK